MKFLLLLLALPCFAGTVTRVGTFNAGERALSSEVNAEFDNIIATLNGGINSVNIQDAGVVTDDLASFAVSNAKIASYTVTKVTFGSLGQQLSSLVENTTMLVTANLAQVSISSTGRPVFIGFVPSSAASDDISTIVTAFSGTGITTEASGDIMLTRVTNGPTFGHVARWKFGVISAATADIASSPNNAMRFGIAPGSIWTVDPVPAGIYTYILRAGPGNTGSSVQFRNLKLIAYEL